jgi:hypothetical protein
VDILIERFECRKRIDFRWVGEVIDGIAIKVKAHRTSHVAALLHRSPVYDGPREGSTSPFADQARPVAEGIRLVDIGVHLVSIARLKRRTQRTIPYSIDTR